MGRQTFDRIKKTVSVLLAVLFVVSLTASACAACTDTTSTSTPTSDTDSKTVSPSDLGAIIAGILNNMGYNLDLSDSESSSSFPSNYGSSFSFPSSLFDSLDTSGTTV